MLKNSVLKNLWGWEMKSKLLLALIGLAYCAAIPAQAMTVNVHANSHSWANGGNGNGLSTGINLTLGDVFSVTLDPLDTWNLCSNVPGCEVDADGKQNGNVVFGTYNHSGFSASFGTLVGRIDTGNFFVIGTSGFNGPASQSGELRLFNWDHNVNNVGSIAATVSVSAVPLPAALPLLAGGLGLMGLMGWRRKRKVATA